MTYSPFVPVNTSATAKRLAEETLDFAGAQNREFVFGAELVHAENGDDVLEIAITLENFLHATRDRVMLFAHDFRRERFRGRSQRIDRRINAELGDGTFEHDRGIQVRERVRRRRIGQIVRRDVDRLDGRDRPFFVEVMRSCRSPISAASVG